MNEFFWLSPFFDSSEPEPILRDAFSGWNTGNGIFDVLVTVADMPWKDAEFIDNSVLDVAYFGNHSGGKFCSPLVKYTLNDDGEVPAAARTTLAKIIVSKYLINWQKLWNTNDVTYNPIHNYDMHEERDLEAEEDNTTSVDGTLARTGTDSMQHGMVETIAHGRTDETVTSRYGLNTVAGSVQPSDKINSSEGGTTTTTDSGTDTNTKNLLDTTDSDTVEDNNKTEHEEIHRYGNVGVTTSQKMIADERQLWIWNYFEDIFRDLDKELALAFHDPCRV